MSRKAFLAAFLLIAPIIVEIGAGTPAHAASTCNWSLAPRAPIEGIGDMRTGIAAPSPNRVWVVADDQHDPIVARFDGTSWRTKLVPDPGYVAGSFHAITAIAPGDIWAVGWHRATADGRAAPLAANWDGSAWTAISPPASTDRNGFLSAVSGSGSDDVWAVGYQSNGNVDQGLVEFALLRQQATQHRHGHVVVPRDLCRMLEQRARVLPMTELK